MKNTFWNQRIPTLLGILVIIAGIATTTYLTNKTTIFQSNASSTQIPQNIRISNITDNSFTISFLTTASTIGSIRYGKDTNLGQNAIESNNQNINQVGLGGIHIINVRNLEPQTKYYFNILSGNKIYTNNNKAFEIITGAKLDELPQNLISGKIILTNGTTPKETIIYLTADNAQVISTSIAKDGSYKLDLNLLRRADSNSYYSSTQRSVLKMLAFSNSLSSNIIFSKNQSKLIPTITLSKNYDFTESIDENIETFSSLENFPSFISTSSAKSVKNPLKILLPKANQEFLSSSPVFKGSAAVNSQIIISIKPETQVKATIKADTRGNWSYQLSTELPPGNYTISVSAKNTAGITQITTQSFVILAPN